MRKILLTVLATLSAACETAPAARARDAKQHAPDFTLPDTEGNQVALRDLLRRGPVVLAFFPKAFTTG